MQERDSTVKKVSFITKEQINRASLFVLLILFLCLSASQYSWNDLATVNTTPIDAYSDKEVIDSSLRHASSSSSSSSSRRRRLTSLFVATETDEQEEEEGGNDQDNGGVDPIDPHNKKCRDYLKAFLQGSTDTRDECQGLENAYAAADCTEEMGADVNISNSGINALVIDGVHDSNETDDTPSIDDFFQEFQCCKVISHYYSSRCLYHHQYASLSLFGIVAVLILCNLTKSALHYLQIKWLPDAGGCILVGSVVGAIMTTQLPDYQMNLGTFNPDLFLYILLPPIILHASLSIDKQKFRSYIFPIMMFAVVGTILSAIITGFSVHYLTRFMGSITTTIPLLDSMIFGALISSIDPVAVLSIMHSMGVSDTNMLYVLVFGESILNDGVSIAMFESLVVHLNKAIQQEGSLDEALIWSSAKFFWKVSWLSILIGIATGIACTMYFWALRGRHGPVAEVTSFFCFAMLAYYVSDGVGGSGIVSIMVAGILMDVHVRGTHLSQVDEAYEFRHLSPSAGASVVNDPQMDGQAGYPLPSSCRCPSYTDWRVMFSGVGHISNRAKAHVGFVADVLSNLMETAIFAYLGLFLFSNKKWDDIPLVFVGVSSCIVSRVVMIAVVSLIVNVFSFIHDYTGKLWNNDNSNPVPLNQQRPRLYIDRNMQLVLVYSGMRGAVSLALVENIPLYDAVTKHGSQFKPALKAMTSSSIIFTVFVFGASTYFTLKKQRADQQSHDEVYSMNGRRSLMTSLLQSHPLELREDQDDRTTPPWVVDQSVLNPSNHNNNTEVEHF